MEEEEIVKYIRTKVDYGNTLAYTILTRVAVEMFIANKTLEDIKNRLDELCNPDLNNLRN